MPRIRRPRPTRHDTARKLVEHMSIARSWTIAQLSLASGMSDHTCRRLLGELIERQAVERQMESVAEMLERRQARGPARGAARQLWVYRVRTATLGAA